jgi:type I restriction enzyme M protein
MLDNETKRRIDTARDILVGKVPDPKSQVEQITIALVYKFMDDMDKEAVELGGKPSFFTGDYERYAWSKIFDPRIGGHEMLGLYGEAIVKLNQNPNLPQLFRDIFKNAYLPYRDPETLKLFLKTINEFSYDHSERLGDAFEYLLSVLGSQGDAGQFRTPRHIIDFMVQLANPQKHETVLDPACGTAGFLISSYKHILKENCKKVPGDLLTTEERKKLLTNFKGYDISPDMVRLSLVNMYLHGFVQPQIMEYDTLTSEERWNEYADVILANPPFMTPKGGIKPHKKFSVQSNRSEVLFVDYIAEHLTPTGRAAIIVPEGIIFQSATAYKALRKMLIENHLYAVVSLPAGIFNPYSGVKTSILLMDRQLSKKTDSILFVKIENDGFGLGAQRREQTGSDLPDAANVIKDYITAFRNNKPESFITEEKPCSALLVKKEKLAENGEYNLTGDRYRTVETRQQQKWPMVELGELLDIRTGKKDVNEGNPEGLYPFFTCAREHTFSDVYSFDDEALLIAGNGDVGSVKYYKGKFEAYQRTYVLTKFDRADPKYLYYNLRDKLKETVSTQKLGNTMPYIKMGMISTFKIPLPPLEVQREIVAEIEGYQKLIDGCRQVVDSWKPQIDIDPEWPMVKLGDVCEINPKKSEINSLDKNTIVSFLPMEDVSTIQDIIPIKERNIEEVYKGYTYFKENDVLVAKVTPCFENGKSGIARYLKNGIGFGSSELHVIRPSSGILPEYIYPFISSSKFLINGKIQMTGTGGLQRVPKLYIQEFQIPLPPIEVQREIVAEIEGYQKLIDGCRELIKTYEDKIKRVIDKVWEE